MFQGSLKGVTRVFLGCFKEVSRMFQESFKGVSRKFQVLKGIYKKCKGIHRKIRTMGKKFWCLGFFLSKFIIFNITKLIGVLPNQIRFFDFSKPKLFSSFKIVSKLSQRNL